MRILLVSTYDLGRQPFGLASPAAWLRRAGADVACVDTSRDALEDDQIRLAELIAFYLPMHTATRLAVRQIERVRVTNPEATLVAYGLYAPLNASWLRDSGVSHVLGPEAEEDLVALANSTAFARSGSGRPIPRLQLIQPDRAGLPTLDRYAALQMPDGTRRVVGSTDATRGCKHLCRHCPIVPVYRGTFRAVPLDVVLADAAAQVAGGAQHISFGDPDFFNGPRHAQRVVERLAAELPGITYDVTIKIEHLLQQAGQLPLLRDTGCLFVTSAVESLDDDVLAKLRKGHTRSDFFAAVDLCRRHGLTLSPTFVPFTPWTSLAGCVDLIEVLERLELAEAVAPIQLGIRLLVTAESALLELDDLRAALAPFDPSSLTWPWRHADPRVDALQREIMEVVGSMQQSPRAAAFAAIAALVREGAGMARATPSVDTSCASSCCGAHATVPRMTEAWYCCSEPVFAEGVAQGPEEQDPAYRQV